jgi:hypothetical protein
MKIGSELKTKGELDFTTNNCLMRSSDFFSSTEIKSV